MFVNMTVNSDALTILVRSYMRIISNFREMTVIFSKKTVLLLTDFCWGCRKKWSGLPIANASQNSDHIKCNGEQNSFSNKGSDHNEHSYHINTSCQHDTFKYLFENHLRGNKLLKCDLNYIPCHHSDFTTNYDQSIMLNTLKTLNYAFNNLHSDSSCQMVRYQQWFHR